MVDDGASPPCFAWWRIERNVVGAAYVLVGRIKISSRTHAVFCQDCEMSPNPYCVHFIRFESESQMYGSEQSRSNMSGM